MKAKICDRCGATFRAEGVSPTGISDYQLTEIKYSAEWCRIRRRRIDLCPECRRQIKKWMAVEA